MKAVILNGFGGSENFEWREDNKRPRARPSDVLVKIQAAGFNPIDYQMRNGASESARMHSPVLGREFSGIIESVGNDVAGFAEGDMVYAASGSMGSNGTYAEYISLPATLIAHMPKQISFAQAAGIPVTFLTALQVIDRVVGKKSESILVTGAAGGVGLAFIKMLISSGYREIVATAGNNNSRKSLLDAGLKDSRIINYKNDCLNERIKQANGGRLFDIAVDLVGGKMSDLCAENIRTNGIYADVTSLGTEKSRHQLFDKGAAVINISNYAYSLEKNLSWYGDNLNRITRMLNEHLISPPPILAFEGLSVDSVRKAHEMLEGNLTNGSKLVMKFF